MTPLLWYKIPDFLFFNRRPCRFGFAEGKEFSFLKGFFRFLFRGEEMGRKAGGKNNLVELAAVLFLKGRKTADF